MRRPGARAPRGQLAPRRGRGGASAHVPVCGFNFVSGALVYVILEFVTTDTGHKGLMPGVTIAHPGILGCVARAY